MDPHSAFCQHHSWYGATVLRACVKVGRRGHLELDRLDDVPALARLASLDLEVPDLARLAARRDQRVELGRVPAGADGHDAVEGRIMPAGGYFSGGSLQGAATSGRCRETEDVKA